ncbi:MipA/OmpV family protein [Colwellia sp. E2M01]|uniref:MipA/OmpV family protein n=1 Tax=Colwellia sp. E2M01 TaxID=2841561 RepID=UPI001C0953E2|nr:MipA/OmpV family protein [Colwellia sp. E2M01]MBU2869463.1 MipA/OmpV family protein [Colwellia sp. E2M01]
MKFPSLFILIVSLLSSDAFAEENRGNARERIEPKGLLYGFGLGVIQEVYKGYDYKVIPLPIIGYRGDNFRILGPFASYDAFEFHDIKLNLQAAPRFQGFDDSDSYIFENMAPRKFSMDAGLGLNYERHNWKVSLSGMYDILRRSNGFEGKVNISHVLRKGPIFFEPKISLNYLNAKNVNYYYGVKADEVNAFTYEYQGEATLNTSLGLSISTPIFFGGFTQLAFDYTWYGSAISKSPLVETDRNISTRLFFSKFF